MKASHTIRPVFDDPNLVSAMRLGETAGLDDLLEQRLSPKSPNPVAKATSVIGRMLAGADSIDGLDVLRRGGMVSSPLAAPVIAGARLRPGNVASATGTDRLLTQAISTARATGVTGQVLARADSAYYGHGFVGTS